MLLLKLTFTKYGNRAESSFSPSRATRTSCRLPLVIEGGFDEKQGYKSFMQLYKKGELPEIIFAVAYPAALGIYVAADEIGLTIPQDIDVICFGGSEYKRFFSTSLTYMDQPAETLGKRVPELIIEEIKNPEFNKEQNIVIPSKLIVCQTCRNRNGVK